MSLHKTNFPKLAKIALVSLEVAVAVYVAFFDPGPTLAVVSALVMFLALAYLCERREVVFASGYRLWKSPGHLFSILPVLLTGYALAKPAPSWFPTDSSLWAAVPMLVFGVAAIYRDWSE